MEECYLLETLGLKKKEEWVTYIAKGNESKIDFVLVGTDHWK